MAQPGTVSDNNVVSADLWGMPFYVGDRVSVFDGNAKSPTNGTWLRGRVYKLAGPKVGVHIEEGGHWEDLPKHMIPTRLVRLVDVENAVAVIQFSPNVTAPDMAKVTYSKESAKADEWIPMEKVSAQSDLQDARALEKWIEMDRKLQEQDPNGLTELSQVAQVELATDLEKAIRNEVTRRSNRHDERTHQWRLLKLSTSRLLHKHCIQPHDRLKKVVLSWRQNKVRIPLGNEAAAIADYWERFKGIKQLQMESSAEPELEYKELVQNVRGNSYPSSLFPLHSHGFYQMNFPPQEHELKKFPIHLDEYPVGELPAQPPGACTKAGCDPENAGRFCFMDEVRRSEPPMWRKAAMQSDRCEEIESKTEEERSMFQRQKWVERSKRAILYNAHIDFVARYGVRTEHPIALSSYYEPTVLWRRDLQTSIERRFTTVPITAFYRKDYAFCVPYSVWALTSSPLRINVRPKIPNLVVNQAAHTLDGRKLILTSPVTLTITAQYITTSSSKQAQTGSAISMTIVPVASAVPSAPAACGMLPGIEETKEVPLVDLREESWKEWMDTCAKMEPLAPVTKILRDVIELEKTPHLWLHAITLLGDAIHLLRTIPMIRPTSYCENDIKNFEVEDARRTEPLASKRGHTPDQERATLHSAKKHKVDPTTFRKTLEVPPAAIKSPDLSREPTPIPTPSPSPPPTPPAPSAPPRAAASPPTPPEPAPRIVPSVARARTPPKLVGLSKTPPMVPSGTPPMGLPGTPPMGLSRTSSELKPRTVARARTPPPKRAPLAASGAADDLRHDSPDTAQPHKAKRPASRENRASDDDDPFNAVVSKAASRAKKTTNEDWADTATGTREPPKAKQETDRSEWNHKSSAQHKQWESSERKDDRWGDWQSSGWKDSDWKKKYSSEYKKRGDWHR
eukprot:GEMP01003293.1.p1 GENE.GEMP01003293.1~~GEMP01003293.1.p1  ORF type:complete len:908 (+),score=198.90 GEMP01003293.1:66-2789(+)